MKTRVWASALGSMLVAIQFQTAHAGDLLLLHGHIYTGNTAQPWAEALSATAGRIDAVGSDRQILEQRRPRSQIIDLKGRTVIPGIVDAHVHLLFGAMALHGFNLSTPQGSLTPAKPVALIAAIRDYAAVRPKERILIGRGDFAPPRRTRPPAHCSMTR